MGSGEWTPGKYYTDASGGTHTQDTNLRRVGYGIFKMDAYTDHNFGERKCSLGGLLPGTAQTVNRGELLAAISVLEHAAGSTPLFTLRVRMFGAGPLSPSKETTAQIMTSGGCSRRSLGGTAAECILGKCRPTRLGTMSGWAWYPGTT